MKEFWVTASPLAKQFGAKRPVTLIAPIGFLVKLFSLAEVVKNMKEPPRRRLRLRPWTRLLRAASRHQDALLISSRFFETDEVTDKIKRVAISWFLPPFKIANSSWWSFRRRDVNVDLIFGILTGMQLYPSD